MVRTYNHPGSHTSSTLSTVSHDVVLIVVAWSLFAVVDVRRAFAFSFWLARVGVDRLLTPVAWWAHPYSLAVPSARHGQVFVNARSPTNENFYSRKFSAFRSSGYRLLGRHLAAATRQPLHCRP